MKKFNYREFSTYFVVGGIATVIDWLVFAFATIWLGLHHLIALAASMGTAGLFHYFANKKMSFQCTSQQYGRQISVYILVALVGFGMSFAIISGLIYLFYLNPVWARILTTVLMLLPNYILHKYITFNQKIFAVSE